MIESDRIISAFGEPGEDRTDRAIRPLRLREYVGQTAVLIWGDTNVPYGQVIALMSSLKAVGATSLGLVTENPEA